jgi:hypothetical protein
MLPPVVRLRFFAALTVASALVAHPLPGRAQTPAPPPAAAERDGAHDFDFLIGDWKAHLRQLEKPLTGSTTWTDYDGVSRHHKILNTNSNFEEFEVHSAATGKHKKAQTLRLYDPKTREWNIYLVDADNGTLGLPATVGKFHDGVGEFYDMELWNGRTILVRYQWRPAKPGPHFEQAFSTDAGKTWEVNWICDLAPEK